MCTELGLRLVGVEHVQENTVQGDHVSTSLLGRSLNTTAERQIHVFQVLDQNLHADVLFFSCGLNEGSYRSTFFSSSLWKGGRLRLVTSTSHRGLLNRFSGRCDWSRFDYFGSLHHGFSLGGFSSRSLRLLAVGSFRGRLAVRLAVLLGLLRSLVLRVGFLVQFLVAGSLQVLVLG